MIPRLRSIGDGLFTAAAPLLGQITVAEFNQGAQALGALAGFAYLVWKWSRESRESAAAKPKE
jgi:hypothetical protein